MVPISYEQAEQIANDYLKNQPWPPEKLGGLVLKRDATITKPYGWVFFYNTRQFLEGGDRLAALGGNAPLLVERANGKLIVLGTAHAVGHYLAEYEAIHHEPSV